MSDPCPHSHHVKSPPLPGEARPAVFLDRDGTLVRHVHYLSDPDDLELLPGVGEAMRQLQAAGWALVVCTNQSAVARGHCDLPRLAEIHDRFLEMLATERIELMGIYFCPHHAEATVEGYAVACGHRKPKPGMLLTAAAELNLKLAGSWMVGDSVADVRAGRAAGCRTVRLTEDADPEATLVAPSLLEAVPEMLVPLNR